MRPYGPGILKNSQIFFYTPKETDSSLFLYDLCVGLYECDKNYIVERSNYDSFLLLHVISGSVFIQTDRGRQILESGEFAIIDCYKPHIYGSTTGCKIIWFHFDGALSRNYYDYIYSLQKGNIIMAADKTKAYQGMSKLYSAFSNHIPIESAVISKYIIDVLTEFMHHPTFDIVESESDIEKARIFINENLDRQITLEEIAAKANLSVYYFTRCFKKEFGYTPHEYLIKSRLNTACFYLVSSDNQIKEIAYRCGFTNESNFCTCFKKNMGCTPAEYRENHKRNS